MSRLFSKALITLWAVVTLIACGGGGGGGGASGADPLPSPTEVEEMVFGQSTWGEAKFSAK